MVDLDNPAVMFSGMLIGMIGLAAIIYGRKAEDIRFVLLGVVLSVVPFLAHTLLALWGVTVGCCSLFYVTANRV